MENHQYWHSTILLFLLFIITSSSSTSALVSGGNDGILQWSPSTSTGRTILQVETDCPTNMELLNYTILTSQCKPPYDRQPCCAAFAELVCPYATLLNNLTTKCGGSLFRYIDRLDAHYPKGYFSNVCATTKDGIPCPAPPPTVVTNAQRLSNPSPYLMLTLLYLLLVKVF